MKRSEIDGHGRHGDLQACKPCKQAKQQGQRCYRKQHRPQTLCN